MGALPPLLLEVMVVMVALVMVLVSPSCPSPLEGGGHEAAPAVAGGRHAVYWNSSNPRLYRSDYTLEVKIGDYVEFYCPHYLVGRGGAASLPAGGEWESHLIHLVPAGGYRACDTSRPGFKRFNCDRPRTPHDPLKYVEKIQLYTPFSLGAEFLPGRDYYYISVLGNGNSKKCLRLKVSVCCANDTSRFVPDLFNRDSVTEGNQTAEGGKESRQATAQASRSVSGGGPRLLCLSQLLVTTAALLFLTV
ncbi:ephrin-A2-like isoform X1 [Lethenteron reissneri]|uniref:ephrin-A2-like isoform X1 n=1 Tax=Lethenteron reissneri TaxID=7753 RepID=UPI002AB6E573|nr:ephrin-A2-like isoform X1 [Lethenteron reissneri]